MPRGGYRADAGRPGKEMKEGQRDALTAAGAHTAANAMNGEAQMQEVPIWVLIVFGVIFAMALTAWMRLRPDWLMSMRQSRRRTRRKESRNEAGKAEAEAERLRILQERSAAAAEMSARWAAWTAVLTAVALLVSAWPYVEKLIRWR